MLERKSLARITPLLHQLRRPRIILLGVGLLVLLLLSSRWWSSSASTNAREHGASAVSVDAATVSRADVPVYLEGLGTVQAFYTVTVTCRVDGQIEKVGFVEGQMVKKGDLIAQIDPRPFR